MTFDNTRKNLDGRDELFIALIASLIPVVTLGALIF